MKQLFGVIGCPISHSMSPDMHNDAFNDKDIDAYYQAFEVQPENLETAIIGMKALGIKGFNVTVPHKTEIIPLLDRVDPLAAAIGAVNTVKLENHQYVGYNTDGLGYVKGLLEKLPGGSLEKINILIIGAGGAARAIFYTLLQQGARKVDIANRTVKNAQTLIENSPFDSESDALSLIEAEQQIQSYHLIVNTTSIGMKPKVDEIPLVLNNIRRDTVVSDIIYNPLETKFLSEAKKFGAITENGIPMFIYQGALAFQIWTGIEPDIERMKQVVLKKLGG